ncbi:MAG: hypothetical protein Q4E12_05400 [Coriobacteriia bacterium]|nr:hypothetical protein [Coriobacteriia bacterium]
MSTMITARIPDEVVSQGRLKLQELGASTTDLVRAAYDYLIAEGKLPGASRSASGSLSALTPGQKADLQAKLEAATLHPCINLPANWDYKEALAEQVWDSYEALA